MNTLSIALLTNRYSPSVGGIESHVQALANALARRGHEVTVLTHRLNPSDPKHETVGRITVRRFAVPVRSEHFKVSPALGKYLYTHANEFDVIHAHGYQDSPALVATLTTRTPLVFSPHYHSHSDSKLRERVHTAYRSAARKVFERSAAVLCVSSAEEALLAERFPSVGDRTRVISNGVDIATFAEAPVRPELSGKRSVLVAGRLTDYKQIDKVIEAMIFLRKNYVLNVIGDGPARSELERLARTLGLERSVRFLGHVSPEEFATQMRSAAAFVSLSTLEAQGIVLLEAAACGTPAVASNIAAHLDVAAAHPGAITTVSPNPGPGPLAEVIASVAGRRTAVAVNDWDTTAEKVEEVYLSVTNQYLDVGLGTFSSGTTA
jgi:glycosyltransferase involved in cell wall biosynthesis